MQNVPLSSQDSTVSSELPFDIDESSVSVWLANLPVTDKIETCKTVFVTLKNLNRHSIDIRTRFAVLEKFRTVVVLESSNLAARLTGAVFPLEPKTRKIAKLAAKFYSELASGYQLISNDPEFGQDFSSYEQARVLHRIVRSLGMYILRAAQMYEPPSSRVWDSLKKIYSEAESNHLFGITMQDTTVPGLNSSTIAGDLGLVVLFSVSNPYRYSQTEMERVFRLFEAHCGKIEWRNVQPDHALFAIDLENPSGPQHSSSFTKFRNQSLKGIDLSNFFEAISQADVTLDHQPLFSNAITISALLHHLGRPNKIRIKSLGTDTELTLGFEKITGLLRLEYSKPSTKIGAPLPDWLVTPNFELLPLSDDYSDTQFADPSDADNPFLRNSPPKRRQRATGSGDTVRNSAQLRIGSSTFRCEVHQSELPGHVLVELSTDRLVIGQIVSFRDANARMQIGIIRWMQANTDTPCFYYGVECMNSQHTLANIIICSSKHNDVLLFENHANGLSTYSLIMPPAKYPSGTRLTVKQPRSTGNFVIQKLLETSLFFCHYSLKPTHRADRS